MSPLLGLYRLATRMLAPLAPALLKRRARAGKEDSARLGERLGYAALRRPEGALVWLHGASVGESLSLLPLIAGLRARRPGLGVLVTSGTVASAELMVGRLPPGVPHQYAPVDAPMALRRFLAHWRPSLLVLVESELWPNLILETQGAGVRLALVSARMSKASLDGWTRAPGMARRLLAGFALIKAQDDATAGALVALGGRDDGRLNLKTAAGPLPADLDRLKTLRAAVGARPLLLAASTHLGEDEVVMRAFAPLRERAILVVVPRHARRGPELARLGDEAGFRTRQQGAGQLLDAETEVFVADGLGELGLWFRLARAAFIGGSLVADIGGHNPLEPALLDCPVISGRKVANWAELYGRMGDQGLVAWADDAPGVTLAFEAALDGRMDDQAARAKAFAEGLRGEMDATLGQLLDLVGP